MHLFNALFYSTRDLDFESDISVSSSDRMAIYQHLQDIPNIQDNDSSLSSSTIHVLSDDERERAWEHRDELDNLSEHESVSITDSEPSTEHDDYDVQDPIVDDAFQDVYDTWNHFIERRVSQLRHRCLLCDGIWLCPGCLATLHSQQDVIEHAFNTHGLQLPFFPVNQVKQRQGYHVI